jgi:hypothetical protein
LVEARCSPKGVLPVAFFSLRVTVEVRLVQVVGIIEGPCGLRRSVASGAALYLSSWKRVTEPSVSLVGKFTF